MDRLGAGYGPSLIDSVDSPGHAHTEHGWSPCPTRAARAAAAP